MTNPRIIAAQILEKVIHKKQSLSGLLPADSLVRAICYGVLRHLPRLEFFAARLLKQPLTKQDLSIQMLLFIGIYQLMEMDVPDHAAISEAVECARTLNKEWGCALINGVLRSFQRQFSALDKAIVKNDEALYEHPDWLIKLIKKSWPGEWQAILKANNVKAPMFLRVNQAQITPENYLALLTKNQIPATLHPQVRGCIQLTEPVSVIKLPEFNNGFVSVQDAAPQLAVQLMQLQPGLRILDVCAAPGGKTTHMLETEPQLKEMIAIDIDTHRSQQIKENLKRLKLKAFVIAADATDVKSWWNGTLFDRILIDAPCSGSGVIRRHPDIKYLRRPSDFEMRPDGTRSLPYRQYQLLEKMWALLKPKGLLVYATCSVVPEENHNLIQKFLKAHRDACAQPIQLPLGFPVAVGWQLFPQIEGHDGFYYAVLRKS